MLRRSDVDSVAAERSGNRFLDTLPAPVRDRLIDGAPIVPIRFRDHLREPGDPLDRILFPLMGVVSIVHRTEDLGLAEIALVGDEGFVGVGALLGQTIETESLRAQADGAVVAVEREHFVHVVEHDAVLHERADRYAATYLSLMSLSTACNALHPATRRLARWILRMQDRIGGSVIQMTQEIAALLIGVRRATVTRAMSEVVQSGAVRYDRGAVLVLDRVALENLACSCYREGVRIGAGTEEPAG